MSFDLTITPTLHAVTNEDEQQLQEDLQARLQEAVRLVDESPDVVEATAAERASSERVAKLKKAERTLSAFAREIVTRITALREEALDTLITSAGEGEPEFKAPRELAALEHQGRQASRAIERLVERRIPQAQVAYLREQAHSAMARARAFERIAQERAENLIGRLRDAVNEEVVLPVDLSKGVSGALLAYATEFRSQALQISEAADQMESRLGVNS
jgi:hypothetical protein